MKNERLTLLLALCVHFSTASSENPDREDNTTRMDEKAASLHILAVLTSQDTTGVDPIHYPVWTHGRDIILGGLLAEEHINNASDVLEGFVLKIVPIFVPLCNPLKAIDSLVDNMTSENLNIVGVVGMFCDEIVDMYSPFIGHNGSDIIQLVGSKRSGTRPFPHLFSMLPSLEGVATAVLGCLQELNWTRIGVLKTGGRSITSNYVKLAEVFQEETVKRDKFEIAFHYELTFERNSSTRALIQALRKSEVNVIVTILPPAVAHSILCSVISEGDLMWPEYVWIFLGLDSDDVIHLSSLLCSGKKITNIIFFTLTLDDVEENSIECPSASYDVFKSFPEDSLRDPNVYADVIYDSAWSLALAVNESIGKLRERGLSLKSYGMGENEMTHVIEDNLLRLTFYGRTGCVELGVNGNRLPIEMVIVNTDAGRSNVISWYNLKTNVVKLNQTLFEIISFPPDKFKAIILSFPLPLIIFLHFWNGSIFILVSLSLFAFIFYRKEPEIKSSSFILSIPIFLGCYFLLHSATSLVIVGGLGTSGSNSFRYAICNLNNIPSSIGIDLVIGTLLIRSLRIYIFFHLFRQFTGKNWSDSRLVLWIILIVSIKMTIFVFWMILDTNHLIETKTFLQGKLNEAPYYLITRSCYSDYIGVWIAVVYGYSCALMVPLLILAFKTRKIKRGHFKDTKKTNILVICLVTLLISIGALWGILRQVGYEVASMAVLSIGYSSGALLVQVILFFPKVIPPLVRCTHTIAQHSPLIGFKSEQS